MPPSTTAEPTRRRRLALLLGIGGAVGLAAAITLLIEKIALIEDPDYVPTCSINPVLSCGSIMSTPQSEVFGFPNPILGVAGFAVVTTIGVVMSTGASLPRWFWVGLQVGVTFGVVFVHWLIYQSLYRIGALCHYCMVVWAVTIPIFLFVSLANLRSGALAVPATADRLVTAADGAAGVMLTAWYLAITGLVLVRFWDYWVTLLP